MDGGFDDIVGGAVDEDDAGIFWLRFLNQFKPHRFRICQCFHLKFLYEFILCPMGAGCHH